MIPIRLKPGVILTGCRPEILLAVQILAPIYEKYNATELVITSGMDGYHSSRSLHYSGSALDFRILRCGLNSADWPKIELEARTALGADFDVVLEVDHLHVEFSPRRPREVARGAYL